ncbi:MAG: NUDIX hydrolase [Chloroflexi bacterium]|nr:NUDIX hydrolase [Chloroflexota bacterium]
MPMTFCPECGRRLVFQVVEGHERPVCDKDTGGCGFIDFGRYSLGVGGIVVSEEDGVKRVLLIERNAEPNRGTWTIPGGFCAWNETAQVAVAREVQEETGVECEIIGLVAFRNRVDPTYNNSYAVFLLRAIGGKVNGEPTEEIATAGFYTLAELDNMPRLSPLSRALAVAALTDALVVLHPMQVTSWVKGHPVMTLWMG